MKQYDPKLVGIIADMVKSEHDQVDSKHERVQDIAARHADKTAASGAAVEGHNTRAARVEADGTQRKGVIGTIRSYFR